MRSSRVVTILLVEQYVTRALGLADYVYLMNRGQIVYRGEPSELEDEDVFARYLGTEVPAEELIWHRLFINERHRHDMSDIVHLILCLGDTLDWERLVGRVGEHWPLLLSQVLMFSFVYPGYRSNIPRWVPERLLGLAQEQIGRDEPDLDITRGPLISRFSFTIDVREWGFRDPRTDLVRDARNNPAVRAIVLKGLKRLAAAIAAGDGDAAAQAMRAHLENAKQILFDKIRGT